MKKIEKKVKNQKKIEKKMEKTEKKYAEVNALMLLTYYLANA